MLVLGAITIISFVSKQRVERAFLRRAPAHGLEAVVWPFYIYALLPLAAAIAISLPYSPFLLFERRRRRRRAVATMALPAAAAVARPGKKS